MKGVSLKGSGTVSVVLTSIGTVFAAVSSYGLFAGDCAQPARSHPADLRHGRVRDDDRVEPRDAEADGVPARRGSGQDAGRGGVRAQHDALPPAGGLSERVEDC